MLQGTDPSCLEPWLLGALVTLALRPFMPNCFWQDLWESQEWILYELHSRVTYRQVIKDLDIQIAAKHLELAFSNVTQENMEEVYTFRRFACDPSIDIHNDAEYVDLFGPDFFNKPYMCLSAAQERCLSLEDIDFSLDEQSWRHEIDSRLTLISQLDERILTEDGIIVDPEPMNLLRLQLSRISQRRYAVMTFRYRDAVVTNEGERESLALGLDI